MPKRKPSWESEVNEIRAKYYRPTPSISNDVGWYIIGIPIAIGLLFTLVNTVLLISFGIDITGGFPHIIENYNHRNVIE